MLFTSLIKLQYPFWLSLGNAVVTRTDCVEELVVWLYNKLYFHHHVKYILSEASKLLGLINFMAFFFSGQPISVVRLACSV
jgi:hypothetical protein